MFCSSRKFGLLIVMAVGILLASPLIRYGYPYPTHDGELHFLWLDCFSHQLWSGELYPRWLTAPNNGLGSPSFYFYAPLPYYVAAIFWRLAPLSGQVGLALGWSAVFGLILSGMSALWCLRRFAANEWAIVTGAIIYMAAPYHFAMDLLIRGANAEFWAFVWTPLILGTLENLRAGKEGILETCKLGLWIACLVLTHPPTAVTFGLVAMLFALFSGRQVFKRFLTAGLIAAGLSAVYWLPLIFYSSYVSSSQWDWFNGGLACLKNTMFFWYEWDNPSGFLRFLHDIFYDDSTFSMVSPFGDPRYFLFVRCLNHIFFGFVSTGLIGILAVSLLNFDRQARGRITFFLVSLVVCLMMMTPISLPLYRLFSAFRHIQFTWRFLGCATMINALLGAILMDAFWGRQSGVLSSGFRIWMGRGLTVIILEIGLYMALAPLGVPWFNESWSGKTNLQLSDLSGMSDTQHRPVGASIDDAVRVFSEGNPVRNAKLLEGTGEVTGSLKSARQWVVEAETPSGGQVLIRQFWFPGWLAYDLASGKDYPLRSADKSGLIQVEVPAGRHVIGLHLAALGPEIVGRWVSIGTAGGFGLLFLLGWLSEKFKLIQSWMAQIQAAFLIRKAAIVVVVVGGLLAMPMIGLGYPHGTDDGGGHLNWVECFSRQLWSGEFYPRWLAAPNDGLGTPSFFFYGPFGYWVGALFWQLAPYGAQAGFALGWAAALALILSGMGMFWCFRRFAVSERVACIGAIIYMAAPYHLAIDLLDRGANAEFWAFIWMPLIIGALENPAQATNQTGQFQNHCLWGLIPNWFCTWDDIPWVLTLGLSLAGLLYTHVLSVIMFVPVVTLFALSRGWRTFRKLLAGGLIALGLTAIYWLPLIAYRHFINGSNWEVDISQTLFFPTFNWHHPLIKTDRCYRCMIHIFTSSVLIGLITLIVTCGIKFNRHVRINIMVWVLILLGCQAMMLPVSLPVYHWIPPLRNIQFSWRFLGCVTFSYCLLIGLLIEVFWKNGAKNNLGQLPLWFGRAAGLGILAVAIYWQA